MKKNSMNVIILTLCLGFWMGSSLRSIADETAAPTTRNSPEWLKQSVVYEVFPRNFSEAGDLKSITARLDELEDLGVNILWLMPIHPTGEKFKKGTLGSPFAVRDFYAINPDYGTTNDFRELVDAAHGHHMRVVMDVVAGQTSWDSVLMQHPDFYMKDTNGAIVPPDPAWKDVAGLNYDNPEVRHYMINMMKYWLGDFHVDGFRCDVAPNVPLDFWEQARSELEQVNPQVVILADAGARPELLTNAFDVDSSWSMNYALDLVMTGAQPASYIQDSWQHTQAQFPAHALHLRFTDNHEEPRAIARYGMDGALAAQVLMLTLDGVPMFYNGMEAGDATESADPALFEKLPIFWHPGGRPPLRAIYHDLIQLRRSNPALCEGSVRWIVNSQTNSVLSFLRQDDHDQFLVLINLSGTPVSGTMDLTDPSGFEPVSIANRPPPLDSSLPDFQLVSHGWFIFHRKLPSQ